MSPAHAPYNFIFLNQKPVLFPPPPDANSYYPEERYTGHIQLTLTTESPFYIRDGLSEEEAKKRQKAKDKSSFYSPYQDGKPVIPWSSIKGMLRDLIQIVSYGKFLPGEHFEDKKLYFRAVASPPVLRREYQSYMIAIHDHYFPKARAGILLKKEQNYVIQPCQTFKDPINQNNSTEIFRLNFITEQERVNGNTFDIYRSGTSTPDRNLFMVPFSWHKIFFKPIVPKPEQHWRMIRGKKEPYSLKYALINDIQLPDETNPSPPPDFIKGYVIASGPFNSKHMHWIISEADPNKQEIPIDVEDYKNDTNRTEQIDLLKQAQSTPQGVPCFYITKPDNSKKILAFGHTGLFRLAYKNRLQEFVPDDLKIDTEDNLDLAEVMFGKAKRFAGRVFPEDAVLKPNQTDVFQASATPKILATPKPTCIQHYLEQKPDDRSDLWHYNNKDQTWLRGYKRYWPTSGNHWAETDANRIDRNTKQYTKITPVRKGICFEGRIRFENLSEVELGALLFVLQLEPNHVHQLGMGKPLGLGSLRIESELFLSDRKTRYDNLWAEWEKPLSKVNDDRVKSLRRAFETDMLQKLGLAGKHQSIWEFPRLEDLKSMMNMEIGKKLENKGQTRYMQIEHPDNGNEYRYQPKLPTPDVITKHL